MDAVTRSLRSILPHYPIECQAPGLIQLFSLIAKQESWLLNGLLVRQRPQRLRRQLVTHGFTSLAFPIIPCYGIYVRIELVANPRFLGKFVETGGTENAPSTSNYLLPDSIGNRPANHIAPITSPTPFPIPDSPVCHKHTLTQFQWKCQGLNLLTDFYDAVDRKGIEIPTVYSNIPSSSSNLPWR